MPIASGGASAAPAGTEILNVAQARFQGNDGGAPVLSNPSRIVLDEVLDIGLATNLSSISLGANDRIGVPFTLTNTGNGPESFLLSLWIEGGGARVDGFAYDRDGDGKFDPIIDQRFEPGRPTTALAPFEARRLLAIVSSDGTNPTGRLMVEGRTATGSGAPGTVFPGKGVAGGDAVVGATHGTATLTFTVAAGGSGSAVPDVALVKRQSVLAPDGTDQPIAGAVVTYTLEARFDTATPAQGIALSDRIPDGTAYVPGSITLDGQALTDATDGDGGGIDGSEVKVALGDGTGPATRIIQFQVTIQ